MTQKSELMAAGMPAAQASKLGLDPLTAVTAAGTTQGTATLLTANNTKVTTSSIGAGVQLNAWTEQSNVYNSGPNTLTIYPPTGSTFVGLALNAGLTVATNSGARFWPAGLSIAWNVSGP